MDRESIINSYSKNDFRNFLNFNLDGNVLELFNEQGINILKNSSLKNDRINYILAFSSYRDELFKNVSFVDVFLDSDFSYFEGNISYLNLETCNILIERCIEKNKDVETIATLFNHFSTKTKINIIENMKFPEELLYELFKTGEPVIVQKILSKQTIDLTKNDINLKMFFSKAKESAIKARSKRNTEDKIIDDMNIPSTMITKEVAEKICEQYDIFSIRAIINDVEYCTDSSYLNQYVKNKENEIISNYDFSSFISPFKEIYNSYKKMKIEEEKMDNDYNYDYEIYRQCKKEYRKAADKINYMDIVYEINKLHKQSGIDGVEEYLRNLNERMLSNYIVDFLFEENYHNVMIDVRELLNFYYNGNIALPIERVEIYEKISNIDYLPSEEKKELFMYLKNFNIIEMFYDDMRFARDIVAEAIKEYSLTASTLEKYKNKELSEKYGVDVYDINDDSFFGIVKTRTHQQDELPTGHSYSLVGNGCIAVFGDVKDSDTFLYDAEDMNTQQLVHAFPFDSFTYYHPLEASYNSTRRINTLMMPEELLHEATSYTELLLLERGKTKTDIDNFIPQLKRIALYCIDEIRNQDIEKAKANNVGIILVSSSKYAKKSELMYKFQTKDIDAYESNYFDGTFEKDKFEARR